ncbi:MAG TPA: phenylalanine--tRNA ligase subunit beta [Methylomirabilota bacterium]
MRIPYRWLRELVDTAAGARDVAERLTMAGIEASPVAEGASELAGLVVAEVLDVAAHPASGTLRVCEVSTGAERFRVVCGAPNVRAGVRAAFATPGARLPGGRRVDVATIRGTVSEGMLCSEAELGVGDDAAGILLLGADAPVGADLVGHLGLDDAILEVEVTPNRPDCLSILGVAREVAALTGSRLRPPDTTVREDRGLTTAGWRVTIEAPDLCPRYAARLITDVTVGPSPAWLAQRLRAAGLRPINNVVDVTNYVLWELGHPLHAFDGDLLAGRHVVIRRARPGEVVATLDGQSRSLGEAMLVIADAERAVAVAGVMGGANTEVRDSTRTVLLESAYFAPGSIRRTAKALGLSTEASYRFERGADIEGLRDALDRAARLIAELGGGRVATGVLDAYPVHRRPLTVPLRLDRIRRVVGALPPREGVAGILRGLGFPATEKDGGFEVVVPAFRRDVAIEDDLVEEVARIWGYGQIPSTLPSGALALTRRPRALLARDAVRRALSGAGCQEAVTLSMVDPAHLRHFGLPLDDPRVVRLQNPLGADRSVLRPTLLLGLLEAVATNVRRQAPDVRLFEIGRVFEGRGAGELPREDTRVAIVVTGHREPRAWFAARARADVFDVKGVAEALVEALGRGEVTVEPVAAPYLEEGRAVTVLVQGTPVGTLGELHPDVQRAFDLPQPVFVAELSLDAIEALPSRTVQHRPLARHPGIQRDLAVVVAHDVPSAKVSRAIEDVRVDWLQEVVLFDVYEGAQVGPGRKSLAYGLLYQAADRTLTDAEVNRAHADVVARLRAELGAEVRGPDGPDGAGGGGKGLA